MGPQPQPLPQPPLQATLLFAWKREFAGAVAVKEERGTDFHDSIARTEGLHPRLSWSRSVEPKDCIRDCALLVKTGVLSGDLPTSLGAAVDSLQYVVTLGFDA